MISTEEASRLYQKVKFSDPTLLRIKEVAELVRGKYASKQGFTCYSKKNLAGACGDASKDLRDALIKIGIPASMISGHLIPDPAQPKRQGRLGHFWVESQGYVFDVTATQFGFKRNVFIFPVTEKESIGYIGEQTIKS